MLTDPAVRQAKPKVKPYKLADERSMYLLVTPAGGRLWRLDYRYNGMRRTLALGSYPDVSLAKARDRRDEARRLLADGIDPGAKRKAEKLAKADTFRAVAEEFLAQREKGWAPTHSSKVRRITLDPAVMGGKPCIHGYPGLPASSIEGGKVAADGRSG